MNIHKRIGIKLQKTIVLATVILLLVSCATHKAQVGKDMATIQELDNVPLSHTFYLVGNTGDVKSDAELANLNMFGQVVQKSDKNSTLVFLGNNVSNGMTKVKKNTQNTAVAELAIPIEIAKNFKGETVFINGNKDWRQGYEGVKKISNYLTEQLANKKTVLPRKICGLERLKINDETVLLVVDSEWYLQDWDTSANINEDCDIKTREDFFEELRGEINKNQNKVVVLAMHHPIVSNGKHGGYSSVSDHIFPFGNSVPLPVLGSIWTYTRALSGLNAQDLQSKKYNDFSKRLRTFVQMYDNVIVVSAHENNLQYIDKQGVQQIISGAMSNVAAARAIGDTSFSTGSLGFAKLDVTKDQHVWLSFYQTTKDGAEVVFRQNIKKPSIVSSDTIYPAITEWTTASVYPAEWTNKTGWYRFLWGQHYRTIYSEPIHVKVADLSKLHGGFTPTISGGGNQSMSLRLKDATGKEYVMRGVRKSVSRFVQTAVFKDQYVMESFDNTWAERFIYDFYTTSHPFTPFVIGDLSEAIGLYHTNPELYYIPKQATLGHFNAKYGNELYMIEERPTDGHEEESSFGHTDAIVSTTDLIANLRKDSKYQVDEIAFMRARIFDMLIGDWDRHGDQWRWSEFKVDDKVIYKPIPRDRDQAFAKIDGALLSLIKKLPPLRHMQNYTTDFANPRWINKTAFPLDQYILKSTTEQQWQEQAQDIVAQLTDEVIDQSFAQLPKELQDDQVEEIKRILKIRRSKIVDYLPQYYHTLRQYVVLAGTDKKDYFNINRLEGGAVRVSQYKGTKSNKVLVFEKEYNPAETKEIWIYGLNDKDEFAVSGANKAKIKVRLIGGKNQDLFTIDNAHKVHVYDYADKDNTVESPNGKVRTTESNNYDLNNFNYENLPLNITTLLPNVGYNPEDGIKAGFAFSTTRSKFVQDPFTAKHTLKGLYSFKTKGVEFDYKGMFPNATTNWMFTVGSRVTSPNFAVNFYGIGNETFFFDEERGDEYKRVSIQSYSITPGYRYQGKQGGMFEIGINYEALKVADKANRFVTSPDAMVNNNVFDFQQYGTAQVEYQYKQANNKANPTIGFGFETKVGWKVNLNESTQNFGFLDMHLSFGHFIDRAERFVFASNMQYQTRFKDTYAFYHAATIGGNGSLRGFRPDRFTGKSSFVQTTDIRYNIGDFTAGFLPMTYGIYGGFDYGRVWTPNEQSDKWHNSYGMGMWLNVLEQATLHCSYFSSVDGGRFVFGLGFGF